MQTLPARGANAEDVVKVEHDRGLAGHGSAQHDVRIDDAGRLHARESAWIKIVQEQSICQSSSRRPHGDLHAHWQLDIGGCGSRLGKNLENPSTSRDAQSSPLQLHPVWRRPTPKRAAAKRSLVFISTPPARPRYFLGSRGKDMHAMYVVFINVSHKVD